MSDRFSVQRGNPGSTPVKTDDISKVSLESPVELRPQLTIQIENCADVGENPCDQLNLEIYNVMGQEDKFRRLNGRRVDNGGQARIVLSTDVRTDITAVEYAVNPSDEDSPALDQDWDVISQGENYHEFFVPTDPSSLYAFRVSTRATDCPDTTKVSDIYYFSTGDEIVVKQAEDLTSFTIEILPSTGHLQVLEIDFNDTWDSHPPIADVTWATSHTLSDVLVGGTHSQTIAISDSFSYSIS